MGLINQVNENNMSLFSKYNKWYSILQFKPGENNISQYNFNFNVYDVNNKNVILHSNDEIDGSVKRSLKISPKDAKLYICNKDLRFENCNYIISPVKNDNEIQIHIIDSEDSDRRVLIYTPKKTYRNIMSIRDTINFDLIIRNKNYSIDISNNTNKYDLLSKINNKLIPNIRTKIIESDENIWDEFICADSSVGIRIQDYEEIKVDRN